MKKFKLSDSFVDKYKDIDPNWGPLGEFVYLRTYSRKIPGKNRNEYWCETVRRVVEGAFDVQKKYVKSLVLPWSDAKGQKSAQIMFDKMFNFKFLPSGRSLWMMGSEFISTKGGAALNSCGFVSTEDIDTRGSMAFCWNMDLLMVGAGIGFDTKGAGKMMIKQPLLQEGLTFVIPDTREGWVESLGLVIDAYFYGRPLPVMDYSLIRPEGSIIKGFGGVASGPYPLMVLHKSINKLLSKKIGQTLSSVDITDMFNFIGVCVVAGNIRRSSGIAVGDHDDEAFITMKDYNLHPEEVLSHRWSSNNSIFAEIGITDYDKISKSISLNGEPGIVWLENLKNYCRLKDGYNPIDGNVVGINPCGEQSLENMELCNLVETFPSMHENYNEYKETLKSAYLYAKTVTLIPTHWESTNAVLMKNRRIGMSQSGIIDAFVKHGRREIMRWCDEGYSYLKELDAIYSDWLCIPRSKKITSIKPSGSVSLLPGVSAGIHYQHSKFYIRRVRVSTNSPLTAIMKNAGYEVEFSKYGSNEEDKHKTSVISFPVKENNFDKKKDDVSAWEQVKNCIDYQSLWADNNVSITVTFKPEEQKDIPYILRAYEDSLKAISFLPISNHGYEQAPYEEITEERYEELASAISKPDFSSLFSDPEGEKFCDSESCSF